MLLLQLLVDSYDVSRTFMHELLWTRINVVGVSR